MNGVSKYLGNTLSSLWNQQIIMFQVIQCQEGVDVKRYFARTLLGIDNFITLHDNTVVIVIW